MKKLRIFTLILVLFCAVSCEIEQSYCYECRKELWDVSKNELIKVWIDVRCEPEYKIKKYEELGNGEYEKWTSPLFGFPDTIHAKFITECILK